MIFFPIISLGYLLMYLVVNKGYNICSEGTSIDINRNPPLDAGEEKPNDKKKLK
jgi:hypothetical protein